MCPSGRTNTNVPRSFKMSRLCNLESITQLTSKEISVGSKIYLEVNLSYSKWHHICDPMVTHFAVEWTLGTTLYQIRMKVHFVQSSQKPTINMSMIDGTHWFWSKTHYLSWGESQGLINGKL